MQFFKRLDFRGRGSILKMHKMWGGGGGGGGGGV